MCPIKNLKPTSTCQSPKVLKTNFRGRRRRLVGGPRFEKMRVVVGTYESYPTIWMGLSSFSLEFGG
jgi:hypothetical protein